MTNEEAFCIGFAYGARYGYEEVLDGKMSDSEIGGTWFLSQGLYEKYYKEQAEKKEEKCNGCVFYEEDYVNDDGDLVEG